MATAAREVAYSFWFRRSTQKSSTPRPPSANHPSPSICGPCQLLFFGAARLRRGAPPRRPPSRALSGAAWRAPRAPRHWLEPKMVAVDVARGQGGGGGGGACTACNGTPPPHGASRARSARELFWRSAKKRKSSSIIILVAERSLGGSLRNPRNFHRVNYKFRIPQGCWLEN